ncbi:MAG: type II toxin-antitoxin system PemK/MazF family toxin [Acidobacteria bacterium]|nr:type II toxin-antitoxin system PemK/MazF family toxin [Acidobacteriota bacterium]
MICESWDVVTVPFPFTETARQKRRPALILSQKNFNRLGHAVMAMITSAVQPWPSDTPLSSLAAAGLSRPCVVRLKLFTLDNRLIITRIGHLADEDKNRVAAAMMSMLAI